MITLLDFCSFPWWLMWLLPFLLGLALGWAIWGKYKRKWQDAEDSLSRLKTRISGLEKDLSSSRSSLADAEGEIAIAKGKMREAEIALADCNKKSLELESKVATISNQLSQSNVGVDSATIVSSLAGNTGQSQNIETSIDKVTNDKAKAAKSISPYSKLKADNLQIIEGIGPKMESVLHENGVDTWSKLADQGPDNLRELLAKYGDKYKIVDPTDWSRQAKLASEGDWTGLIALQKELDGNAGASSTPSDSKLEKYMIKHRLIKRYKRDDLKVVEGIGPKIEKLLKDAGINTWEKLSESDADDIQKILDAAGSKFKLSTPKTWPQQAKLAHEEKWEELDEYQDFLNGGREA